MKAINRIIKELQENHAEQNSSILENYQRRPEDVTMPWEKIPDQ